MYRQTMAQSSVTVTLFLISLSFLSLAYAQTYYCTEDIGCTNGACCGLEDGETQGICGYGPEYCGDTCVSNCTATAPCGKYAEVKGTTCPLNVCCSAYGFCGTTSDFCTVVDDDDDHSCQSNCESPTEPSCSSNNVLKKVIGYYESWSTSRVCDSWTPSNIAASSLTHINYAFALFTELDDDEWAISWDQTDENDLAELISEFIDLKTTNPGLSCFLSIGGWSFNDGDTADYWSRMASTAAGRKSWSKSVLHTVMEYGFDGVDLDWEYPVASDRGGSEEDAENYIKLLKELRSVFDEEGTSYGITFTIPTSYWYLQNFNISAMVSETGVNWVNVMSYDLHGTWDGNNDGSRWTESVLAGHTNLTEIKIALDLLWRNDVDPSKIVLGMGFYGRTFTLDDTECSTPGCAWAGAGQAGDCTATAGILSYKEIVELMADSNSLLVWDEDAAVNYMTYGEDQWVSFDTNQTFQQKIDFANDHCLGGIMIWAVDQDTYDWQALSALLDDDVNGDSLLTGGSETTSTKKELATAYSAYTGADCYVTDCFASGKGQCQTDYSVLEYVHDGSYGVIENLDDDICDEGDYRMICCPTSAMPEGCLWSGDDTLYGDGMCAGGTSAFCGTGKYELIQDSWTESTGDTKCVVGARSLCCNTNTELELCSWTDCMGSCSDDLPYAYKYESYWEGPNTYKNCEWKDGDYCMDTCPDDKVLITQRPGIVNPDDDTDTKTCSDGYVKLCCDPPDATVDLPVDPEDLFQYPDDDDVSYYYNVEESSNEDATNDDSKDPFALVMITGDTDAYDESLVDQWTFLDEDSTEITKRDVNGNTKKRSIFKTATDTFENVVETHRIRCSSLVRYNNETGCQSIFNGGARNTIVKMPDHIGAGPYARVVSLERILSAKRDTTEEEFELVTDYDLAAASEEDKGNVNFRIDYTNLLEYWDEITDSPADRKRWFGSFSNWLKKMTTIVEDEEGSLPLEYEKTLKLFHFQKTCPKLGTSTLDLDANIHIGLYSQYGYYFEGSILPVPELISAYAYFSIEPAAAILMTLRGEATVQTSSDVVNIISGVGLPGLSIKGLISIGPEFALTGSMDASLSVSGEINAGVSLAFDKTTVYFPNTEDAAADDAEAGSDGNALADAKKTYSVDASLDAAISATGNLALSLTPEVKFGISVLGGTLMEGYVTAGVTNTIEMGVSASTSASTSGDVSAEFCYWADYTYKMFISADVSFVDDLIYWGGAYDVYSSDEPLTLVEEKCYAYSNSDSDNAKRSTTSLVKNSTASSGCFSGLINCGTEEDELSCDSSSDDDSTASKRACTVDIPALFYNCDFMGGSQSFTNLNENTQAAVPSYTFIGICENVRNYLDSGVTQTPSGKAVVAGSNWMELTYLPSGGNGGNRADACSAVSSSCASTKSAMWPTGVYNAAVNKQSYKGMAGYIDSISCDEFPFNASEEGGNGAEAACVPVEYQTYQGQVNAKIPQVYDITLGKRWDDGSWPSNNERKYTVTLMYGGTSTVAGQSYIGKFAGSVDSSSTWKITNIIGGINLMSTTNYRIGTTTGNNGVCQILGQTVKSISGSKKISKWKTVACKITFTSADSLDKRGLDSRDGNNWVVENVELLPGWEKTSTNPDGSVDPDVIPDSSSEAEALVTPAPELGNAKIDIMRHLHQHIHSKSH
ncbi:hypothetical protein BKA67DRAFT_675964 [Truncatella angustata]|uniref:chitinase n=1 Tax=Truncatella angustata TaxID=152316 RepID=A0A9P8UNI3_9PEZI|nr:uncharacterized protein BKA67DRAFT_675964 [Truncatella angustata]KAH6655949.1 hypothetical protein BKA67DRAFT_675964 [Truncatella angustata]